LGALAVPYVAVVLLTLLSAAGLIGCLEMTQLLASSSPVGPFTRKLFWVIVDARSGVSWVLFGAMTLAGAIGLRLIASRVGAAFSDAIGLGGAR
jgi:hypothetical protein